MKERAKSNFKGALSINFDYEKVARYDESDVERIMPTDGMIKSRGKVESAINNAKCFRKIREEFGCFCEFLWSYSDGKTILYEGHEKGWIPAGNGLSDRIIKDLKRRDKFLGPTTVYSHLQACGIINDHGSDCECYKKIITMYQIIKKPKETFGITNTVFRIVIFHYWFSIYFSYLFHNAPCMI